MKKIFISIFLVTIICISCNRTLEFEVPPILGEPSSTILTTRVNDSGGGKYVIEVDLHVVNNRGQFINGLNKNNFILNDTTIQSNALSFRILDVRSGNTNNKGDYSAMLLLDQSGSILTTDPYDSRIEACKIFLNSLGSGDNVGLSSFSGFYTNWVEVHHGFTTKTDPLVNTLDFLADNEIGGTPLYYSTSAMVDYVNTNALNKNNKALIVFTDGEDTQGNPTPQQIIEKAKNSGVQIFTIGLGGGLSNLATLSDMAQSTGGYFMWAQDAKQLISYFGTLGNLLNGNAGYYRVRWEVTTKTSASKKTYVFNIMVKLSNGTVLRMAVPVKFP